MSTNFWKNTISVKTDYSKLTNQKLQPEQFSDLVQRWGFVDGKIVGNTEVKIVEEYLSIEQVKKLCLKISYQNNSGYILLMPPTTAKKIKFQTGASGVINRITFSPYEQDPTTYQVYCEPDGEGYWPIKTGFHTSDETNVFKLPIQDVGIMFDAKDSYLYPVETNTKEQFTARLFDDVQDFREMPLDELSDDKNDFLTRVSSANKLAYSLDSDPLDPTIPIDPSLGKAGTDYRLDLAGTIAKNTYLYGYTMGNYVPVFTNFPALGQRSTIANNTSYWYAFTSKQYYNNTASDTSGSFKRFATDPTPCFEVLWQNFDQASQEVEVDFKWNNNIVTITETKIENSAKTKMRALPGESGNLGPDIELDNEGGGGSAGGGTSTKIIKKNFIVGEDAEIIILRRRPGNVYVADPWVVERTYTNHNYVNWIEMDLWADTFTKYYTPKDWEESMYFYFPSHSDFKKEIAPTPEIDRDLRMDKATNGIIQPNRYFVWHRQWSDISSGRGYDHVFPYGGLVFNSEPKWNGEIPFSKNMCCFTVDFRPDFKWKGTGNVELDYAYCAADNFKCTCKCNDIETITISTQDAKNGFSFNSCLTNDNQWGDFSLKWESLKKLIKKNPTDDRRYLLREDPSNEVSGLIRRDRLYLLPYYWENDGSSDVMMWDHNLAKVYTDYIPKSDKDTISISVFVKEGILPEKNKHGSWDVKDELLHPMLFDSSNEYVKTDGTQDYIVNAWLQDASSFESKFSSLEEAYKWIREGFRDDTKNFEKWLNNLVNNKPNGDKIPEMTTFDPFFWKPSATAKRYLNQGQRVANVQVKMIFKNLQVPVFIKNAKEYTDNLIVSFESLPFVMKRYYEPLWTNDMKLQSGCSSSLGYMRYEWYGQFEALNGICNIQFWDFLRPRDTALDLKFQTNGKEYVLGNGADWRTTPISDRLINTVDENLSGASVTDLWYSSSYSMAAIPEGNNKNNSAWTAITKIGVENKFYKDGRNQDKEPNAYAIIAYYPNRDKKIDGKNYVLHEHNSEAYMNADKLTKGLYD